ncbi:MAG: hypothetical protein KF819_16790 [Labilithrix sp.]|nr:hypothetical protein [Labilithrix sp.]
MAATSQVFIEPNAVVVGLADEQVLLCLEVLGQARLRVHRFGSAAEAGERIAKLLPRLVVLPATLPQSDLEMLDDRAIAVGASLLLLDGDESYELLERSLADAVRALEARFSAAR